MKPIFTLAICFAANAAVADSIFQSPIVDSNSPVVLDGGSIQATKGHHPNLLKVGFTVDGRPLVSAFQVEVEPGIPAFDYAMPDRFGPGVDRNNNGIPDIPNSRSYVQNLVVSGGAANLGNGCQPLEATATAPAEPRFSVLFNTKDTVLPDPRFVRRSAGDIREEVRTKLGDPNARAFPSVIDAKTDTEKLRGTFVLDERKELLLTPSFQWRFSRVGSSRRAVTARGPAPRLCLPEGNYDVALTLAVGNSENVLQRRISIEDHLIVVMGDSFAAGEGAPEQTARARSGQWTSNDGKTVNITNSAFLQTMAMEGAHYPADWADAGIRPTRKLLPRSASDPKSGEAVRGEMWDYDVADFGRRDLEHLAAHRSSFSAGAQLAAEIEAADPRSSVTFVNVAATGARIDIGLLGPYAGTPHERFPNGRLTPPMAPQVNQVERLVAGRKIDSVLLSVGGNDMGFARLIAAGFIFERDLVNWDQVVSDQMLNVSFETGDWGWMAFSGGLIGTLIWKEALKSDAQKLPGLNGMRDAYSRLNSRFRDWTNSGLLTGGVTLIAPPFFGSARESAIANNELFFLREVRKDGPDPVVYCRVKIEPGTIGVDEIDPRTFKLIAEKHYTRMFNAMKNGAKNNGWAFVDQGDAPERHGMCARGPVDAVGFPFQHPVVPLDDPIAFRFGQKTAWYNSPQQGYRLQRGKGGDNTGMFHPNAIGYAYAARKMLDFGPDFGVPLKQGWWNDPDDTISEAVHWVPNKARAGRLERVGDVDVIHITAPVDVPLHIDVKGPVHAVVLEETGNTLATTDGRPTLFRIGAKNTGTALVQSGTITIPPGRIKPNPFSGEATAKIYIAIAQRGNTVHDPVLGTRDALHGFGEAQQRADFSYEVELRMP